MDDAPIPPGPQQQGAESNVSNRHPNLYIRRFVDFAMQPELPQPMERDLEAAAAAVVAAPADAAPAAPADAGLALEARLEQLMPLLKDAGNALPFLVLLLIQFASFHFVGICALLWFALLQHRMNLTLKFAALQPSSVQPWRLLTRIGIFGSNVLLAEFLLASDGVWRCWWRIPFVGGALTLPAMLWLIVHNQYLLVFAFAAAKAMFLCAVSSVWNERRIKESLGFIESLCGAWLQLLPVLLWMRYLSDDRFVHSIQPFVIMYLSMKLRVCKLHFSRLRSSFLAVVIRRCPFGQYVPVSECGDRECAICLESLNVPLKLPCDHIFCEACLMSWMQREATCPCCRAVVPGADGGGVPTNDGSSSLVPQIF
jgi:E3 ubiquitin-protein ligase RNFT1